MKIQLEFLMVASFIFVSSRIDGNLSAAKEFCPVIASLAKKISSQVASTIFHSETRLVSREGVNVGDTLPALTSLSNYLVYEYFKNSAT